MRAFYKRRAHTQLILIIRNRPALILINFRKNKRFFPIHGSFNQTLQPKELPSATYLPWILVKKTLVQICFTGVKSRDLLAFSNRPLWVGNALSTHYPEDEFTANNARSR